MWAKMWVKMWVMWALHQQKDYDPLEYVYITESPAMYLKRCKSTILQQKNKTNKNYDLLKAQIRLAFFSSKVSVVVLCFVLGLSFLFWQCQAACRIQPGIDLLWKLGVLTTGPPGKSQQ